METCSFCLGGNQEVPPFGSMDDAKDLIHPCTTCKITTHRKCLIDWFNSLSNDKLQVIDGNDVNAVLQSSRRGNQGNGNASDNRDTGNDIGNARDNRDGPDNLDARIFNLDDFELGQANNLIQINLSPQQLNEWFNNLTNLSNYAINKNSLFITADCPQCKEDIVFSMKTSTFLAINSGIRSFLTRSVQYSTIFLGLTSAVTGVVSMGYIGLTSAGLKIMDYILPESLLVKMLIKSKSNSSLLSSILYQSNYSIDNLESALLKGLIDPFKFSRIPILPIILYRMRQSSPMDCLFSKDISSWLTELMINGYISSLGDHKLIFHLVNNLQDSITNVLKNPLQFWKFFNLFKGVDFSNINNLISLTIPVRFLYDLFFRLTLNQLHFNITMKVRPREIANKLNQDELDTLEILYGNLNNLKLSLYNELTTIKRKTSNNFMDSVKNTILYGKIYISKLFNNYTIWKILRVQSILFLKKLKYCIMNDYSNTLTYKSFTIRCITTIIWPFISSKIGHFIFTLVKSKLQDKDKVLFLCNLSGLVIVVLIKDIINVYLTYKKSNQLNKIKVLNFDDNITRVPEEIRQRNLNNNTFSIPGDYI